MYGKQPLRRFGVSTKRIAAVAILVLTVGMLSGPILAQGTASGIDFQIVGPDRAEVYFSTVTIQRVFIRGKVTATAFSRWVCVRNLGSGL